MKISSIAVMLIISGLIAGSAAEAGIWETDYEKAAARAKSSGKYLFLNFSGSDWCGWCVKLKKEVFNTYEFKRFARENLVCVELDFPRKKRLSRQLQEQNEQLKNKHGVRGFPTIIILRPDGRLVAQTGYREGGAKKYVEYLEGLIAGGKR